MDIIATTPERRPRTAVRTRNPARDAQRILHLGFVLLPTIAGLDKFAQVLTQWERYIAPPIARSLPVTPHHFMMAVGVVEVCAGLLVALRPRVGALVVAGWLAAVVVNLLMGNFFDIALRDFGLFLGALALERLSSEESFAV